MPDLFNSFNLNDICGQDVELLTKLLTNHTSVVMIGPMSSGKTTVLKRWGQHWKASDCPRTSKPDFRKVIVKAVAHISVDRLDRVDIGWLDLLVEAIEGEKTVVATFDGDIHAYKERIPRHLRAKFTPYIFKRLAPDDIAIILESHGFPSDKIDLVKDCGSVGFAIKVLQAAGDSETIMEVLEAGPGHNDPDAPTVHRGLISDAVSTLIKECRRGDVREVAYWATVLLYHYKAGVHRLVRRLVITAGEDHHCIEAYLLAQAVASTYGMIGGGIDQKEYVLRAWCLMASLPKWWDSEVGRAIECHFGMELGMLEEGVKSPPSYALDTHTWTGRRMQSQGKHLDWRMSGALDKRLNMMMLSEGIEPTLLMGSLGQAVPTGKRPETRPARDPWKYTPIQEMLAKWGPELMALRLAKGYDHDAEVLQEDQEDESVNDNGSEGF